LVPALDEHSDAICVEYPIIRKPRGEEERNGRIDFWSISSGYSYGLEIKHSMLSIRNKSPHSLSIYRYREAYNQIEHLNADQKKVLLSNAKGLFLGTINFLCFWMGSHDLEELKSKGTAVNELFNKITDPATSPFYPQPNFQALWIPPPSISKPAELISDKKGKTWYEIYPALAVIGLFKKVY